MNASRKCQIEMFKDPEMHNGSRRCIIRAVGILRDAKHVGDLGIPKSNLCDPRGFLRDSSRIRRDFYCTDS